MEFCVDNIFLSVLQKCHFIFFWCVVFDKITKIFFFRVFFRSVFRHIVIFVYKVNDLLKIFIF